MLKILRQATLICKSDYLRARSIKNIVSKNLDVVQTEETYPKAIDPVNLSKTGPEVLILENPGSHLFKPNELNDSELTEKQIKMDQDQIVYINIQKQNYLSKERQKKYFRETDLPELENPSSENEATSSSHFTELYSKKFMPKNNALQIKKIYDLETLLKYYNGALFYLNSQNLYQILNKVIDQYPLKIKETTRQKYQATSQKEKHLIKFYNRNEPRIFSQLKNIQDSFDEVDTQQKIYVITKLAKLNKHMYVGDIVENLLQKFIKVHQLLSKISVNQLVVLIWVPPKAQIKNKEILTRMSLELENRLKILEGNGDCLIRTDQIEYTANMIARAKADDLQDKNVEPDSNGENLDDLLENELNIKFGHQKKEVSDKEQLTDPLSTTHVSVLLNTYAQMNVSDPDIIEKIQEEFLRNGNLIKNCSMLTKLGFLSSFRKLRFRRQLQEDLIANISQELNDDIKRRKYEQLSAQNLKTYVSKIAQYHDRVLKPEDLNLLNKILFEKNKDLAPQWITECLWAFGASGIEPNKENGKFQKNAIFTKIEFFNSRDIVMCLYSLYKLDQLKRKEGTRLKNITVQPQVLILATRLKIFKKKIDTVGKSMVQEMDQWSNFYHPKGFMSIL